VTPSLEVLGDVDAEIRRKVESGLAAHVAKEAVPARVVSPLSVVARDENGSLMGAALGRTVWGWLHVSELWVEESHRRKGIGKSLMVAAEQAALERGCHAAYLDTFDFQAVPFYERLGYSVMGTLQDFPLGHVRLFLQKRLDSEDSPNDRR
jgi:GNAT superfamily N-acetyltransferase